METRKPKETVLTRKHVARLERERRMSNVIRWVALVVFAVVLIGGITVMFLDGTLSLGKFNIDYLMRNRTVVKLEDRSANLYDFQLNVRLQRQGLLNQYFTYAQYAQFGLDVNAQLEQIQTQLAEENAAALGQQVVDSLVNDLIIRREAEALGISVSDAEIDERIHEIFGYFPDGTPTPTLTPTSIVFPTLSEEQLALVTLTPTPTLTPDGTLTNTPEAVQPTSTVDPLSTATSAPEQSPTPSLTPTSLPTNTPTFTPTATFTPAPTFTPSPTATPYTLEGFEQEFSNSMDSYAEELNVSETDYRKLVEAELLRKKVFEAITGHLTPFDEQVWARHILVDSEETANEVLKRFESGEDWSALASEYSSDTSNKDQGGDLGWFGRGMMVPEFETAAFAVAPGKVSRPIQTQFGWHLIQVIGHEERPITESDFEQKKQTYFEDWLAGQRREMESAGLLEIFDIWMSHVPTLPNMESLQRQMEAQQ